MWTTYNIILGRDGDEKDSRKVPILFEKRPRTINSTSGRNLNWKKNTWKKGKCGWIRRPSLLIWRTSTWRKKEKKKEGACEGN